MTFPVRYLVYAFSTSCITCLYALRLAFHSTIICQVNNATDSFLHDDDLKQYTYQSVGVGLALGLIPLHFLNTLGTRRVTALYGTIGIASALFYPTSYRFGFWPSFITRVFQGAPLGILLWLIAKVASEWTPKCETALAIAILTSVYQLAPFVAQIAAAGTCSYLGWEYTYYILAALSAIFHVAFHLVYSDKLEDSKLATLKEKELISDGKGKIENSGSSEVPYSQLFLDPTVWATWFANLAFFSSLLVFLQTGPVYMREVLGFSVQMTLISGGMAHATCLITKIMFGKVLDKLEMDMTERLKTAWAIIEIPSLCLLVALIIVRDAHIQLACILLFITIHGVGIVIIVKTQTFRSAEHNHVLANGNTLCVVLCLFVQPIVHKLLVSSNTFEEWSRIFALQAALIFVSVVLFVWKVEATPAKWAGVQRVSQKTIEP